MRKATAHIYPKRPYLALTHMYAKLVFAYVDKRLSILASFVQSRRRSFLGDLTSHGAIPLLPRVSLHCSQGETICLPRLYIPSILIEEEQMSFTPP
jgi:hypothetical protein